MNARASSSARLPSRPRGASGIGTATVSGGSCARAASTARTRASGPVTSSAGPATSGKSSSRACIPPARWRSWPSSRRCKGPRVRQARTGLGFPAPSPAPGRPSVARVSAGPCRSARNGPCSGARSARTGPASRTTLCGSACVRSVISIIASGAPSGSSNTSAPAPGGTAPAGTFKVTGKGNSVPSHRRPSRATAAASASVMNPFSGANAPDTNSSRSPSWSSSGAKDGERISSAASPAESAVMSVFIGRSHLDPARLPSPEQLHGRAAKQFPAANQGEAVNMPVQASGHTPQGTSKSHTVGDIQTKSLLETPRTGPRRRRAGQRSEAGFQAGSKLARLNGRYAPATRRSTRAPGLQHAGETVLRTAQHKQQLVVLVGISPVGHSRREPPRGQESARRDSGTSDSAHQCLAVRNRQAPHQRVALDPRAGNDRFVHGRIRARLAGAQLPPRELAHPSRYGRGDAVGDARGAVPVGEPQQQYAAWFQRGDEPVKNELGVADPFEQPCAVHDVERPRCERYGSQVAEGDRIQVAARA